MSLSNLGFYSSLCGNFWVKWLMRQRLLEIAGRVRQACILFRKEMQFGPKLAGMCGIASFALKQALIHHNIEANVKWGHFYGDRKKFCPTFGFGWGHCWVDTENYLIDITASQFDHKPIICGPKFNYYVGRYYLKLKTDEQEIFEFMKYWGGCYSNAQIWIDEVAQNAMQRISAVGKNQRLVGDSLSNAERL